ncbi:dihydrofolate reductase family protein [Nocardioides sp. BP30]|uniref:dihydrofolate reductase family protein n=1 Tax=Nocardioides sp. BP30 TaxID=3036374 RepID=UPI00246909F3|nr:dihydrofolate reductase family protein [Nocardioides sp. BP30]WGL53075.1 dihydrofolate reductase family protein [Nocardioides sp. BP30]
MRTLVGDGTWDWPQGPWLRVNFVASVDGSAQGGDGRSGSINNAVDAQVFHELRRTADVILVGAGTARAEEYRPSATPIVVIGHELPPLLAGDDNVRLASGPLPELVAGLHDEGHRRILCEGGPTLLGGLLAAGLVDELCLTTTPHLVGGSGKRITAGPALDVPLSLSSLVEQDGTLLVRWLVSRP